ncbi:MAG: manganese efflux pump [Alistipes sp.]|nr:manganese efflux pump [Alistipes sp.]
MDFISLLLIAVGLSMDAFAVSVAKGLAVTEVKPRHAMLAGVWFGGFQALMPVIGYLLASSFSAIVVSVDHWIAFALLSFIGLNMIREAVWGDEESGDADFGVRKMFLMAVATSIDALAVGVSLAFVGVDIFSAALTIGVVTFAFSFAGIYLGRSVGSKLGKKAGILGGIVLIAIGIKILIEHLSK